jgi:hypothetical protein
LFGSSVRFLLTQIFGKTVDNASVYVTKWYVFHSDMFLKLVIAAEDK